MSWAGQLYNVYRQWKPADVFKHYTIHGDRRSAVIHNHAYMTRPSRERGTKRLKRINYHRRYALVVLLTVLAGGVGFLFVIEQPPSQEPEEFSQHAARGDLAISPTGSDVVGAALVGLEACNSLPLEAALSNDQNHDGKIDGMADPLVVLLVCGFMMLHPCFVLLISLREGLLLRLREPLILVGSGYYPALERPG